MKAPPAPSGAKPRYAPSDMAVPGSTGRKRPVRGSKPGDTTHSFRSGYRHRRGQQRPDIIVRQAPRSVDTCPNAAHAGRHNGSGRRASRSTHRPSFARTMAVVVICGSPVASPGENSFRACPWQGDCRQNKAAAHRISIASCRHPDIALALRSVNQVNHKPSASRPQNGAIGPALSDGAAGRLFSFVPFFARAEQVCALISGDQATLSQLPDWLDNPH
ncbi:unnamed protein product [Acanthosepion pharaonis]|uniref:Uncharacterized protein n=1 Tax=Acanthosepion pharaonis TaxID=158019 RepID=A0A812DN73_ACAPH|nr:unnamed protein product [Sepia pharaonis]